MKSKRVLSMCMVLLMLALLLSGCNKPPEKQEESATKSETGTTTRTDETIVLKLAHHNPIDGAYDVSIKHFANLVNQKTDGKVVIDIYPAAQLGGERDVLEGLKLGTIDMTLNTSALIMNLTPEFGLLDLPFLFEDYEHARAGLEGEGGQMLADKLLEDHGIRMLASWCSGFRVMLTTHKEIKTLEDFKGLKMRAPETPVYIDMFVALGANPTPIPFGEVYTALQTGVVEGVEVAAEPIYTSKFHEVGKYITRTNHIFSTMCPLINEAKFQSLSPDIQEAILEAMVEATDFEWELFIESDAKAMQAMVDAGCILTEIDREPLSKACESVHAKYETEYNASELLAKLKG